MEDLFIPTKSRRPGLYVFCNKCKLYSIIKDGCLKKTDKCNHPYAKQVYKIKVHIPASVKKCKTITLETREIKAVMKEYIMFKEQLNITNFTTALHEEKREVNIYLFLYQIKKYLDFINNIDIPEHMQKSLSPATIKDYERNFKYFIACLEENNINVTSLKINDLTNNHIELFHKYLVKQKMSNKTYNNIMSSLKVFYRHLIKIEGFDIFDPFKLVLNKKVIQDTQTFSYEEFMKVLNVTTEEAGWDGDAKRNRYKNWLASSFKLAAYSCLRLEELVNLKYKDIIDSKEEGYKYILAENIKVNNIKGNKQEQEKQYKHIPLIAELLEVLQKDFDFTRNKGVDRYIIAPEHSRSTVYNDMTKGFTHYKRIAKIDERKCLKDLRTTYITNLQLTYNNAMLTRAISDHSGADIIFQHYFDKKQAARVAKDFKVFKPKTELKSKTRKK